MEESEELRRDDMSISKGTEAEINDEIDPVKSCRATKRMALIIPMDEEEVVVD